MSKTRTPIPVDVAGHVLFLQDHTCCVCREAGKPIQIHHINDEPTDHSIENLAVLCLTCHEKTQTTGGFARKLGAPEVTRYRDDWATRVQQRRDHADEIAAARQSGLNIPSTKEEKLNWHRPSEIVLRAYVNSLPQIRKAAHAEARKLWDSGGTRDQVMGTHVVADIAERVWCHLATWYPPHYFGQQPAQEYFSAYLASRYQWHRALAEPEGIDTGGTAVRILAAHGVMEDAESAIVQTVQSLMQSSDNFDFADWLQQWNAASQES